MERGEAPKGLKGEYRAVPDGEGSAAGEHGAMFSASSARGERGRGLAAMGLLSCAGASRVSKDLLLKPFGLVLDYSLSLDCCYLLALLLQ